MIIEMNEVRGGKFKMGNKGGGYHGYPEYETEVDSFFIGKYPITQEQWFYVKRENPSEIKGQSLPATNINWYEAIEFCNILSQNEGLRPYYIVDKSELDINNSNELEKDSLKWVVFINQESDGYRLPTEEEWEYAAREGSKNSEYKFSGSDDYKDVLVDRIGPYPKVYEVGQKKPNALGIYDMSGNVGEWCYDWYYMYGHKEHSGKTRIFRGFSTVSSMEDATVYKRKHTCPAFVSEYIGFRIARNNKR